MCAYLNKKGIGIRDRTAYMAMPVGLFNGHSLRVTRYEIWARFVTEGDDSIDYQFK